MLALLLSVLLAVQSDLPLVRAGEPVPGLAADAVVEGPAPAADGVLPVPGLYTLPDGSRVIALADDPATNARSAFLLASTAATHGTADNDAFHADEQGIAARMFQSGGVTLFCGQTAQCMGVVLDAMGIDSRLVQWIAEDDRFVAHQSLEVRLPEGWTLYDPWLGIVFAPGVSALDVFDTTRAGKPIGPLIAHYIHKPRPWFDHPWTLYEGVDGAVGHFDPSGYGVILLEGPDGRLAKAPEAAFGGHPWTKIDRPDLLASFYPDGH